MIVKTTLLKNPRFKDEKNEHEQKLEKSGKKFNRFGIKLILDKKGKAI